MSNVPTTSAQPWPTRRVLEQAASLLDRLVAEEKRMVAAAKSLQRQPTAHDLERARNAARNFQKHGQQEVDNGRAEDLLNQCCYPTSWVDEEFGVRASELSKMLAGLLASFPTSNVQNPAVFTRFMLEDVLAIGMSGPWFAAVENACRELRTTKTFMPAIAEIIAAIKKHEAVWNARSEALDCIEGTYDELVAAIAAAEKKIAEAEAKRRPKAIEHKPSLPMTPVASTPAADPAPARREWWKSKD
jgi:hypothetical protein